MYFDPTAKENKNFLEYFSEKKCMILDPSRSIRTVLKKLFADLTTPVSNIFVVDTYQEAIDTIAEKKPHYVFTYMDLDNGKTGLDLLPTHITCHPYRLGAGFYLISSDNSLASACAVLDEEVDAYLSQPFTIESIMDVLIKSFETKVNPSPYKITIEKAKEQFFKKNYEAAMEEIQKSKKLNKKPAYTMYLEGEINRINKNLDEAINCYEQGIEFNPTHYKCLVSLTEVATEVNSFDKAYTAAQGLLKNYPLNPIRIPSMVKLSICNKKYEDVLNFSKIFTELKDRSAEIQRFIAAGLAVCGKFLFSTNQIDMASKTLMKAVDLSESRLEVIENVCRTFMGHSEYTKASEVIEIAVNEHGEKYILRVLEIDLLGQSNHPEKALEIGQKVLEKPDLIEDDEIYILLVNIAKKIGKNKEFLEDIIYAGVKKFPEKKEELNALLDNFSN